MKRNIKKLLFLATIASAKLFGQVTNGLVADFNLDGNFTDKSTYAIDGTTSSTSATPVADFGINNIQNTAYKFDGANDYISAGSSNRGITDVVTVQAWIKTTSSKSRQFIVNKYSFNEGHGYHIAMIGAGDATYADGSVVLGGRDGGGVYIIASSTTSKLNDGKWHHVCGIVDTNTWQIWVDGKLEGTAKSTTSKPLLTTTSNLEIGNFSGGQDSYFSGQIDNVQIFNTVQKPTSVLSYFGTCTLASDYQFDGTFVDSGSEAITGVSTSNTTKPTSTSGINGLANTAFLFDGVDDIVTCGTSNRGVTNQITVNAWIKTTSSKSRQFIVNKYSFNEGYGYHLAVIGAGDATYAEGSVVMAGRDGGGTYIITSSTTKVNDGKWHQVTGIVDKNKWEIWVDGKLEGSSTSTTSNPSLVTTESLEIGNVINIPNSQFEGSIDNVKIQACAERPVVSTLSEMMEEEITATVYPNPSYTGTLQISSNSEIEEITLTDMLGRSEKFYMKQINTTLRGVLVLKIKINGKTSTQKVVVE